MFTHWILFAVALTMIGSFVFGMRRTIAVMPGTALTAGLWALELALLVTYGVSLFHLFWLFPLSVVLSPILLVLPLFGIVFRLVAVIAYRLATVGISAAKYWSFGDTGQVS